MIPSDIRLERKIAVINKTVPDLAGFYTEQQIDDWIPGLQKHADFVGEDYVDVEILHVENEQEAYARRAVPHYIANVASETPVEMVEGAGGFHWIDPRTGEIFAVSYTSLDGGITAIPTNVVTLVVTHEHAEVQSNGNITGDTQLIINGQRFWRWDENADPVQAFEQGFWIDGSGVIPLSTDPQPEPEPEPQPEPEPEPEPQPEPEPNCVTPVMVDGRSAVFPALYRNPADPAVEITVNSLDALASAVNADEIIGNSICWESGNPLTLRSITLSYIPVEVEDPDPCAPNLIIPRMTSGVPIYVTDWVTDNYKRTWDANDLEPSTWMRQNFPNRYTDQVGLTHPKRLSTPGHHLFPGGYMGQHDGDGNYDFVRPVADLPPGTKFSVETSFEFPYARVPAAKFMMDQTGIGRKLCICTSRVARQLRNAGVSCQPWEIDPGYRRTS